MPASEWLSGVCIGHHSGGCHLRILRPRSQAGSASRNLCLKNGQTSLALVLSFKLASSKSFPQWESVGKPWRKSGKRESKGDSQNKGRMMSVS